MTLIHNRFVCSSLLSKGLREKSLTFWHIPQKNRGFCITAEAPETVNY